MNTFNIQQFASYPELIIISTSAAREIDVLSVQMNCNPQEVVTWLMLGYQRETVPGHIDNAPHMGSDGGAFITDFNELSVVDTILPPAYLRTVYIMTRQQAQTAVEDIEDFVNQSGHELRFVDWKEGRE
jgi:hypothetical protein